MILLVSSLIIGADTINILTKSQINQIDFSRVDLNCKNDIISLKNIDGIITLTSRYICFDLEPYTNESYEVIESPLMLKYSDDDFFSCLRINKTEVKCFEQYVKPNWDIQILNYEYYLRIKLNSTKNNYPFIINKDLIRYYRN